MIRRPPRSTLFPYTTALPIYPHRHGRAPCVGPRAVRGGGRAVRIRRDRKSTRLNSSHSSISYAVFCLKKKRHSLIRTLSAFYSLVVPPAIAKTASDDA